MCDASLNLYDFEARLQDPITGRFLQIDPLAENYSPISPFAYCGNNPITFVDPDGKILETFWDVANLAADIHSLVANIQEHNALGAIIDGVALTGDAIAVIIPIVPGGLGTLVKGIRGGERVIEAGRGASHVGDTKSAIRAIENQVTNTLSDPKTYATSRQARREAMRQAGIPTSQQPKSQSVNASGREYRYDVPKRGGGTQEKSVQQQTLDRSHPGDKHWEAGSTKSEGRTNSYNMPRLKNDKSKVNYNQ